jgi:hypothetical protein
LKNDDKWISELAGVFCDPILAMPGGWGDTIPDWLKQAITMERLIENIKGARGEELTGTDAEACAYLYTASLEAPMSSDWTNIYLYIAGKVYEKWRTPNSGVTMPEDIKVEKLSDYEMGELNRLKRWLYEQRVKVRNERDRTRRREEREAAAAALLEKNGEQLALKI